MTAREALENYKNNRCSRWHEREAKVDETGGQLGFQRLNRELFVPGITPEFKLRRDDKLFAIGSCFARGIEMALLALKMEVVSAASEFASMQPARAGVTGLGFTNKYNTFSIYNELRWALDPEAASPRESIVDVGDGLFCDPHINPALELAGWEETLRRRSIIE